MSTGLDGVKVLLIDDDMDYSETLHEGLHAAGATIACAGTIEEGVDIARKGECDIVLLDLTASFDARAGLDALGALETSLPVILLTGSGTDSEDTVTGLGQGADDYLVKPFTFSDLRARIEGVLADYDRALDSVLIAGDLVIDRVRSVVLCQEKSLEIPADALAVLTLLAQGGSTVIPEADLMKALFGEQLDRLLDQVSERLKHASSVCRVNRSPEGICLQTGEA
jgi:DNA-binding response OmpR family regulator